MIENEILISFNEIMIFIIFIIKQISYLEKSYWMSCLCVRGHGYMAVDQLDKIIENVKNAL